MAVKTAPQRPSAPATFLRMQELVFPEMEQPLELWHLTQDIPGHPQGSTVSRRTLEKAGYAVPPPLDEPLTPPREWLHSQPEWRRKYGAESETGVDTVKGILYGVLMGGLLWLPLLLLLVVVL